MRAPLRPWTGLVLAPERAGGDCGLVGCAALDQDDSQPIAQQCIRPAGHEGQHRFVPCGELEDAEHPRMFYIGDGDDWVVGWTEFR